MDLHTNQFGAPVNTISPAETRRKLTGTAAPFVLDVRQPEEFRSEHIAGSMLIPLGELHARLNELPKNQEIICVCRSGNRSGTAARLLQKAGFRAGNMVGGMLAWSRLGLPVERGQ
jgi:rhodanese-related sulfurtransferase